jgi:peptidoglycan hydrolase-like protein with peptidoglycan-binding domain
MTSSIDTQSAAANLNKPVLKKGSKGAAVKELQTLLYRYGAYSLSGQFGEESKFTDGDFGTGTETAVKAFQNQVFLLADGIVGDKTWRALYKGAPVDMPVIKRGSKGELVKKAQQRLVFAGVYTGKVDGDFGAATETAVKALQTRSGLTADGQVGDRTWFELSKCSENTGC